MKKLPILILASFALGLTPAALAEKPAPKLPTPPEVWKDYNPDAGDFKEEIISEGTKDGIYSKDSYISAYVNGEEVRVFCKYAVKADAKNAPGLLVVHGWTSMPGIDKEFLNDGWAVLAHDYCGKVVGRPHYTKYPDKLRYGNMDAKEGYRVKAKLPDGKDITDPKQTDDYLWYAIQRRALSYLLAQKEVDKTRIGAKGYSYGGSLMWNLGMDPRVKAVVTYFGSGWTDFYRDKGLFMYKVPYVEPPKTPGEELLLSAITPEAHSPYITAPTFWLNGSNDHHGGHERGETNFKKFQPGVPFSFAHQARGQHDTWKLGKGAKLWLEKYVLGKDIFWPARPVSEIKLGTDGVPEFHIKPASPEKIEALNVFYAFKEPFNCARLWMDAKAEKKGDKWVAKIPVQNVDDYVFSFANIRYPGEIVISSDFTAAIPSKLGKAVATKVFAADGSDSWSDVDVVEVAGGKGLRPNQQQGAACLLYGEAPRKAPEGAVLVFEFHCTQPQTFTLAANGRYTADIEIKGSDSWQTLEIPAGQLRFREDPLKNWSDAKSISLAPKHAHGVTSNITWITFKDPKWKVSGN
jgi:dienelactone hydrolase